MAGSLRSLIALTIGCTVAASIFAFGSDVFAWKSSYAGEAGRTSVIQITRLAVYAGLAVLLVFRGGWWGIPAAVAMTLGATALEWLLFPFSYEWASVSDPSGYDQRFGEVRRPAYGYLATYDVMGVGISAALAQGLRMMAHVNPKASPDE